jgi:glyoxylase-like metal-dependent hydrolase (beta-lactamase superfamily II)
VSVHDEPQGKKVSGKATMEIFEGLHAFLWQSASSNNCNTYLIDGPGRVLIDPGHLRLFDPVERGLDSLGLHPADIDLVICTHGHPDHFEAVARFEGLPTRRGMHPTDWELVRSVGRQTGLGDEERLAQVAPDVFLNEGSLRIRDLDLVVIHTPGHSPGSLCIHWPQERTLFCGDVVFNGGVGRVDLPGGDGRALQDSIRRLATLDIERLLPGHGDPVLGADAVRSNFDLVLRTYFGFL